MSAIRAVMLLGICALARGQGLEAISLLEKVASKYRAIKDYVVEITSSDSGSCLNCGSEMLRPVAPVVPSGQVPRLINHIVLARSGDALHYEVNTEGNKFGSIWISDGMKTWRYRADLNQYIEEASSASQSMARPARGLAGLEWLFLTRFRAIAAVSNPEVIREGIVLGDACPGDSVLIEIHSSEKPQAIEQLLIATATDLVCASTIVKEQIEHGIRRRYTTKTSWKYPQLSQPVDAGLFTFTPPKKARKVKRFNQGAGFSPELPMTSAPFGLPSAGPPP